MDAYRQGGRHGKAMQQGFFFKALLFVRMSPKDHVSRSKRVASDVFSRCLHARPCSRAASCRRWAASAERCPFCGQSHRRILLPRMHGSAPRRSLPHLQRSRGRHRFWPKRVFVGSPIQQNLGWEHTAYEEIRKEVNDPQDQWQPDPIEARTERLSACVRAMSSH